MCRSGFTAVAIQARLERLANGELEVLNIVSIVQLRIVMILKRYRVTEFE
jgi:hypothetical protein